MAVLTPLELAELRRNIFSEWSTTIDFGKPIANAALQSIEDWYEGQRASVSVLMNTASAPKSFTNAEKKIISAHFLAWKFRQGG